MAAFIDISVQTERVFSALDDYPRLLGVSAPKAAKRHTRITAQRLMAVTPPHNGKFGTNTGTGNSEESRMIGAKTIMRDLLRIIYPMDAQAYLGFRRHYGNFADRIQLSSGSFSGVAITEDLQTLRQIHEGQRNNRGRVARSSWLKAITTEDAFERLFEGEAKKVGIAKSGWLPAFAHFGGMSPAWIARHGSGNGSYIDNTDNDGHFLLELANHAKSIGSMAPRLVKTAVGAQASAMYAELKKAERNAAFRARLINSINAE